MSIELKIKSKTLAAEATFIRREEQIAKKNGNRKLNRELHEHRILQVRRAARSAHLARGFIRGSPYHRIESKCYEAPKRPEVLRLLERYGRPEFKNSTREEREAKLKAWFEQA